MSLKAVSSWCRKTQSLAWMGNPGREMRTFHTHAAVVVLIGGEIGQSNLRGQYVHKWLPFKQQKRLTCVLFADVVDVDKPGIFFQVG